MTIEDAGRFHATIRPLPVALVAVDANKRVIAFSQGFVEAVRRSRGGTPELGASVLDCFPAGVIHGQNEEMLEQALSGELVTAMTWRRLEPVGRRVIVGGCSPLVREGEVAGALMVMLDAVEPEGARASDIPSEQLELVLHALPMGTLIGGADGRPVYANPRAFESLRSVGILSGAEGLEDIAAFDADTGEPVGPSQRPIARALLEGLPVSATLEYRGAGDRTRILRETAVPMGAQGGVGGFVATLEDVTSTVTEQRSRRQREEHVSRLFDKMDEGFVICRAVRGESGRLLDLEVLEANGAVEEYGGHAPDAMIGMRVTGLFPEVLLDEGLVRPLDEVARGERASHAYSYWVSTQAGRRFLETRVFPVGEDCVGVLTSDRTESRLSMEQVAESERRYRSLFESMSEAYVLAKAVFEDGELVDWTYLAVNDAFEKVTGLSSVVGKRATQTREGLSGTDRELLDLYARVLRTGQPESRCVHIDGVDRWGDFSVYTPREGYFAVLFTDITERKVAEEAVQASERFRDTVEEMAGFGTWRMDLHTRKTQWSPGLVRLFQGDPADHDGDAISVMKPRVHPDDIDRFLAAVDRIHGDGMAGRFTMRIVHDDGSMHEIMGMGTTEYDENGVAVALVGMNIDTSYEMTGLGARLPEEPVVDPLADAARAPG